MNKATIKVTREATISVGDVIPFHQKHARVRAINPNYILLEVDGVKHHVSIESFCLDGGANFTLEVDVTKV